MSLIFVHGTLRKGLRLAPLLATSAFLDTTRLYSPPSVLVGLSKTSYPAVVPVPTHWMERDNLVLPLGEVYDVSNETLNRLDVVEGTPAFYERLAGAVLTTPDIKRYCHDHKLQYGSTTRVWVYGMYTTSHYLKQAVIINNGDWVRPEWGNPLLPWVDEQQRIEEDRGEEIAQPRTAQAAPRPIRDGMFRNIFEGRDTNVLVQELAAMADGMEDEDEDEDEDEEDLR